MNTVTVVQATYNGTDFVEEQRKSLAAQTTLPYELVVSHDGSSDATLDIVRRFSEHAPFPVIVRQNERRLGWVIVILSMAWHMDEPPIKPGH